MERDLQGNLMECDEHAWIVANFLADEDLEYAHRLLSHGADQEGDDQVEMVKRRRILRDIEAGHLNFVRDYIGLQPVYTSATFERRFLLPRELVIKIVALFASRDLMPQRVDATGKRGPSREQKVMCALRILQSGMAADMMDDYFRIGDSTAREAMKEFCACVDDVFSDHFLRWPTVQDLKRLYNSHAARGFPGLIGSLDCTHWAWKSCRQAHAGSHKGKEKTPTIVIEAVADQETRVWHLFVGTRGACNDINVLDRSPLLNHFMNSVDPVNQVVYTLAKKKMTTGYLLVDGIYLEYSVFAKLLADTKTPKDEHYNDRQSSTRKDVERAFGIAKGRYGNLARPSRLHRVDDLIQVARACFTLHNLRIDFQKDPSCVDQMQAREVYVGALNPIVEVMTNTQSVMSKELHHKLRRHLIDHLWSKKGEGYQ